ncbi:hypothetical protein Micbo1qcDRAFT_41923 [Microdochium bolleyi]|uniref:Annexin ANXC4 n=1 Tax=Microdochium bolleyi TaxID=196109 RepID=A0A136JAG5_9PEZI|nr:hypothetical protein Micbo1qcDRAFT_41923 [Microdochium bolleyi]
MSLRVDDSSRRSRSKSPGRRDDRDSERGRGLEQPTHGELVRMPSPGAGYSYNYDDRPNSYGGPDPRDPYRMASPTDESSYGRYGRPEPEPVDSYGRTRPRYPEGKAQEESPMEQLMRGAEAFLPAKYASFKGREKDETKKFKSALKKEKLDEDLAYGSSTPMPEPATSPAAYSRPSYGYSQPGGPPSNGSAYGTYMADPRASGSSLATTDAGSRYAPPTQRMSSLSVSTPHHSAHLSLSTAPPSPLLESYHGTYQSMSPMPSPLLLASNGHNSLDAIEPLSPGASDNEFGDKKKRRARFHDPVDDAARLAKALKGDNRSPDVEPLIEVLPGMTHEQIMELRVEYKRLVKTGPEKKGVNVAKHIRARLKDEDPTLMKACYSTALGRWESEAYWANFWYQGDKTRRELLIESLMGRSNEEIYEIKDAFSDKKYRDSLTQCMRTELKEDKFKRAVLMVLEGRRMDECDQYGRPLPLDHRLISDDVETLYRSVRAEKGGETAMLEIVIQRSDSHLREVLKLYEKTTRSNFARDSLKKSGNLVGEVLAHILNGIINKPVRDALLLNHALNASKRDELRRELLISRLVRFHWDRKHMALVKRAYRERYGEDLADAVHEGTSGDWGLFCEQLVVTRMSDDVKVVERIHSRERISDKEREREERLRERERQMDREMEKQRREREKEKERERDAEKKRSRRDTLEVGGSGRSREKSRERSRSRRRE